MRFLYATIFLTSTSLGAVTFLLPVYAEELGANYVDLGLIGAASNVAYTAVTLISGTLLDRFDRVKLYLAFSTLASVVVLMFGAASHVDDLIILRGLLGVVSAMFWVTASTLTADISPPESLTTSIGGYNLSWILGFIVGPSLGGLVSDALGFPALFVVLSTLAAASVAVIWWRLISVRHGERTAKWGFNLSALRGLYAAFLTIVPYSVVLGVYMAILPGDMKGLGISPSLIGLLLTMTNGVRGLGFINVGRFVAWGEGRSLGLASCLACAALLMVAFARNTVGFVVPLAMFGLAGGIITPVVLNYIARRSPNNALGTVMGVHESVYGAGMLIGSTMGGIIAEAFQPSTLYLGLSALSLMILPLSRGFGSKSQSGVERKPL